VTEGEGADISLPLFLLSYGKREKPSQWPYLWIEECELQFQKSIEGFVFVHLTYTGTKDLAAER
jgi:hypothetical protein